MLSYDARQRIKDIIAGDVIPGQHDHCTTIRNILCTSFKASRELKKDFESKQRVKEKQAAFLGHYAEENNLLILLPDNTLQIARGGEASVFYAEDKRSIIKANDCGYYATWLEYFDSVILHNSIFPNTAYELIGFAVTPDQLSKPALHALVKQPFIISDRLVELNEIKAFLEFNGFHNTMRNDYAHEFYNLILEDMHDEIVLVQQNILFFIDTVFYVNMSIP